MSDDDAYRQPSPELRYQIALEQIERLAALAVSIPAVERIHKIAKEALK
jgi:hypothetical protein